MDDRDLLALLEEDQVQRDGLKRVENLTTILECHREEGFDYTYVKRTFWDGSVLSFGDRYPCRHQFVR